MRNLVLQVDGQLVLRQVTVESTVTDAWDSDDTDVRYTLKQLQVWLGDGAIGMVAVFFVLGILLSLTPCVLPMVPIVSAIITTDRHLNTAQGFLLALVYVLAMALTYATIGFSIGYFGSHLQLWFQQPWVILSMAGLFMLLGLAMLGIWSLSMPQQLQQCISDKKDPSKVAK